MGEDSEDKEVDYILQASAIEALGALWPSSLTSDRRAVSTCEDTKILLQSMRLTFSPGGAWTIRVSSLKTIAGVITKLHMDSIDAACMLLINECIIEGLEDTKYSSVREAALLVILAIMSHPSLPHFPLSLPFLPQLLVQVQRYVRDGVPRVAELASTTKGLLEKKLMVTNTGTGHSDSQGDI